MPKAITTDSVITFINNAIDKGFPVTGPEFETLTDVELTTLAIENHRVIEIVVQHKKSEYEYVEHFLTLDRFIDFYGQCTAPVHSGDIRVLSLRCRSTLGVRYLRPLTRSNTLSSQLMHLTGDGYSSLWFDSFEHPGQLRASGIIVHKSTGKRFFIPPDSIDSYLRQAAAA